MSFPYRIFNDMSEKLKAAEENIDEVRKYYEAKIAILIEEYEEKLGHVCYEASQVSASSHPRDADNGVRTSGGGPNHKHKVASTGDFRRKKQRLIE